MATHPRLAVKVLYLDSIGLDGTIVPDFGALKWDIPILEGYAYEFLRNVSPFRFSPYVGRINPALFWRIRQGPYDAVLIHGHTPVSNWLALLAARCARAKVVCRSEGSAVVPGNLESARVLQILHRCLQRLFYRYCDIVAYSCNDNRSYHLTRGARPEQMVFMPCAVDARALRRLARTACSPETLRRRIGVSLTTPIVVSVGRLTTRKRLSDCISAVATAGRRINEAHLVIIGDGPQREALERQSQAMGLRDRVHFLGFVNQRGVVEALLASDVFVLASSKDPSPKALSEALVFGLPVVCSRSVGTARDLVHDGRNGYRFPCGDVRALAEVLVLLLGEESTRRELGARSVDLAAQWTFEAGVQALVRKLDSVFETSP